MYEFKGRRFLKKSLVQQKEMMGLEGLQKFIINNKFVSSKNYISYKVVEDQLKSSILSFLKKECDYLVDDSPVFLSRLHLKRLLNCFYSIFPELRFRYSEEVVKKERGNCELFNRGRCGIVEGSFSYSFFSYFDTQDVSFKANELVTYLPNYPYPSRLACVEVGGCIYEIVYMVHSDWGSPHLYV